MVELVRLWRKPMRMSWGVSDPMPHSPRERQELAQLRKQLRQVTMERDILAKATAWFANKDSGIDKTSTL
jgi:transposase-like protein